MSVQIDNARESYRFWAPLVRLPVHAWALIGSEAGETSFLTHPMGDHGEAVGSAQWHQARAAVIKAGTGIDVATASHLDQIKAMHWEMTTANGYRHVWDQLMATETIAEAVGVLVSKYEQSGSQARDIARRTALAEQYQKILGVAA